MAEFTFDTSKPETVFNAMLAAFGMPAAPAPAPMTAKPAKRAAAKNVKRAPRKVSAPIEPVDPVEPTPAAPTLPAVTHHVPDNSVAVYDPESCAIAYLYQREYVTRSGKTGASLYAKIYGKHTDRKAASHHVYGTEAERSAEVAKFIRS